ncbi:MAG TPA: response regulator [Kiritimatiellia bacterium]|nr:response regulator [Kiritimatiellia bacterium]
MILVVDDDHAIVQTLTNILSEDGYEVRTAHSGEEAYGYLRDPQCKGMLLDMMMPGINGGALLMLMASEQIKVPVVIMTSNPDFSEDELQEFPNVRRMIRKPFYAEELLPIIRELMPKP